MCYSHQASHLTMMKNGKKYRLAVSCLEDSKIFESHPGSKRSAYQHTDQHHDLLPKRGVVCQWQKQHKRKRFLKSSSEMSRKLPARLLLVLQSLLGVIGGPGCVFHGTLHVRINSEGFAGFVRSAVWRGSLHLFTISPWFSTRTAMSMNISCNSLIDCSSLMNISCLENRFWGNYR